MSRAHKRACRTGKVRFRDGAEARRSVRRITQRANKPPELRIYWCVFCRGYHLTSQPIHSNPIPIQETNPT